MMVLAKILLFPLVLIGLCLRYYDSLLAYIKYRFRIRKKWKYFDKVEDWWI